MKKIICFSISSFVLAISYLNFGYLFVDFFGENGEYMTEGQDLYMLISTLACSTVFPILLFISYWFACKNKLIAYLFAFLVNFVSSSIVGDYFVMGYSRYTEPKEISIVADISILTISIVALVIYICLSVSTKIRRRNLSA